MNMDGLTPDSDNVRPDPVIADVVSPYESPEPISQPPSSSGETFKWFAIGCGALAVLLLLVLLATGLWVRRNFKRLAAQGVVTVSSEVIKESPLSPEQKQQLVQRIEDLGDGFAEGDVTLEQLSEVGEKLVQDEGVVVSGAITFIDQMLDEAPIEDELRDELKLTLQRLARGVIEEQIELEDLSRLAEGVIEEKPDGTIQLKPDLSEEDFREVLTSAREIADGAEIPNEPYEVDFLEEVDDVIDEVLEESR